MVALRCGLHCREFISLVVVDNPCNRIRSSATNAASEQGAIIAAQNSISYKEMVHGTSYWHSLHCLARLLRQ